MDMHGWKVCVTKPPAVTRGCARLHVVEPLGSAPVAVDGVVEHVVVEGAEAVAVDELGRREETRGGREAAEARKDEGAVEECRDAEG